MVKPEFSLVLRPRLWPATCVPPVLPCAVLVTCTPSYLLLACKASYTLSLSSGSTGTPGARQMAAGRFDHCRPFAGGAFGYIVFRLDNRGSENRGKKFEDAIHRNMGDAEVRDQLRLSASEYIFSGKTYLKDLYQVLSLPDGALTPDYAGIRPKLHGPGEPQPDFQLHGRDVHGLDGLVSLFGIESPGLTSSLAIGEAVADQLDA